MPCRDCPSAGIPSALPAPIPSRTPRYFFSRRAASAPAAASSTNASSILCPIQASSYTQLRLRRFRPMPSGRLHVERRVGLALRDFPKSGHGVSHPRTTKQPLAHRGTPVHPKGSVKSATSSARIGCRSENREGTSGRRHPEPSDGGPKESLAPPTAGLAYAPRLQVGTREPWVRDQTLYRHSRQPKSPIQLEREVDVCKLGLSIGSPGLVAAFEVRVVRIKSRPDMPPGARDRDDARIDPPEQGRKEERREDEMSKMVHGELHLEAVFGALLSNAHHGG